MKNRSILVIEDDKDQRRFVESVLAPEGARVYAAASGSAGLRMFHEQRPDLVILDPEMPGMDGWKTCQQIRLLSDVPIIILSALGSDADVVRGLDMGADDYLIRPVGAEVLVARVRAALRRATLTSSAKNGFLYRDDHLTVDMTRREVTMRGEPVKLTPKEFELLAYMMQNPDQVLTMEQILRHVWGWEYQDQVDYVHVHISRLRRKLEESPDSPRYLLTEYGVGYRFARPRY